MVGTQEYAVDASTQLKMLAQPARRQLLFNLLATESAGVSHKESALPGEDITESLHESMHHIHLPKLAECRIIDWDQETNTVTRGAAFEDIKPLLEILVAHQEKLGWDFEH